MLHYFVHPVCVCPEFHLLASNLYSQSVQYCLLYLRGWKSAEYLPQAHFPGRFG